MKTVDVIKQFLKWNGVKNLSLRTLKEYQRALNRWVKAMPSDELTAITFSDLLDYFDRDVAPKTNYNEIILVKQLFRFARDAGYNITADPSTMLPLPKLTRGLPDVLTAEEVEKLVATAATPYLPRKIDIWYSYRNVAIVLFLVNTGVRVAELCAMLRSDVTIDHAAGRYRALVRQGKGRKDGIVLFNRRTAQALEQHWERQVAGVYVFENMAGRKCRSGAIWVMFDRLSRRAGIRHIHPHVCRHTCATLMFENEVIAPDVMLQMRHEHISTTMRYTHLNVTGREKRYKAAIK